MSNALKIASSQLGVMEVAGPSTSPQILQYAKDCGFADYTSDETAWCSLFANWVALKSDLSRSKSLSARSWLNVGFPIAEPEPGDVVVFWRGSKNSWQGHVAFFVGFSKDGNRVYCLGGNQGNQVSITAMPTSQVLGFRRLIETQIPNFTDKNLKNGDTGIDVKHLQDGLKQLGYNCGTSDGIFGPKTEKVLKEFQSTSKDLEINGIFDKKTRDFLTHILKSR